MASMTSLVRLQPLLQRNSLAFPTGAKFKDLLESYFALFDDIEVHGLQELVHFNKGHADEEPPPGKTKSSEQLREIFRLRYRPSESRPTGRLPQARYERDGV